MAILVILIVVWALVSLCTKKKLRHNECPACHRESVESARHWWHGNYRRCKHTFRCGWSELADRKAQMRNREAMREQERADREDDLRSAVLHERMKQAQRNEQEARAREIRGY